MTFVPRRQIDLEALIRAHPYITIERPPQLWAVDADDVAFIRVFGLLIAASLARNGGNLAAVTINVSNVTIEPNAAGPMPAGDFVAVTARGSGDWSPELSRRPAAHLDPPMVDPDLEIAAFEAGVPWAYTRNLGNGQGSVTLLFPRR